MRRSLWTKLQVYNKRARFAKSVTMRSVEVRRTTLLFLCVTAVLTAAPPEVTKVEPPSWWIGHSINPVRVLIRGRNLEGARAVASGAMTTSTNA